MEKDSGNVGVYHKNEIWIEDVMNYFGEYVDKEQAMVLLNSCIGKGDGYFGVMNEIRNRLISMGYSVPFRAIYRRVKDE
jgi:hypothetical protein